MVSTKLHLYQGYDLMFNPVTNAVLPKLSPIMNNTVSKEVTLSDFANSISTSLSVLLFSSSLFN